MRVTVTPKVDQLGAWRSRSSTSSSHPSTSRSNRAGRVRAIVRNRLGLGAARTERCGQDHPGFCRAAGARLVAGSRRRVRHRPRLLTHHTRGDSNDHRKQGSSGYRCQSRHWQSAGRGSFEKRCEAGVCRYAAALGPPRWACYAADTGHHQQGADSKSCQGSGVSRCPRQ